MLMRLDKSITPTRNRLATVTTAEMAKLSKIKRIFRKRRLGSISRTGMVFLTGEDVQLLDKTLVVDCAVNGLKFKPKTKIFQGDRIILQAIISFIIFNIQKDFRIFISLRRKLILVSLVRPISPVW